MIDKLKRIPFFVLLISVFFILHGVVENFGFVSFKDASILLLTYAGLTAITGTIFWLLLRSRQGTALLTTAFMAFFFFYEAFMQFAKKQFPMSFFTSYTFLLSVGIFLLLGLFIYFKKYPKTNSKFYLFINILFIVYILIDTGWLIFKLLNPPRNPLSIYSLPADKDILSCSSCKKPNVYFLLFDEYASSLSLKEHFNYDNKDLDNFLLNQGFHIIRHSNANYNFTLLSMASVLNMSYVGGIKDPQHLTAQDFTNTYTLIRNNRVIKIFSSLGYDLKIYSIFDLAGHPARAWQSLLPLKTRLITARTLDSRLRTSINSLLVNKIGIKYFVVNNFMRYSYGNENFLKLVAEEAERKTEKPAFLYAHFIMPHFPYLFDSLGRKKSDQEIYRDKDADRSAPYLSYLKYTNKRLKTLVQNIRKNDPAAVILLCGDHGFRYKVNYKNPFFHLQNLNAVYFPDRNYSRWGDTVSFVNQFRIVFNQLFQADYLILKDSSIFLSEK